MINRPLTTSSGENTSAPYGIARFLMRLIADHAPDYLGVAFDAGDSFRTDIYPEYKATREKMPDELRASLPRCREIFAAFRVPVIEAEGWEADDVIGTLAQEAAGQGLRTVIVSGDKDFHQLVDDRTALLNPGRGGPAGVDQVVGDAGQCRGAVRRAPGARDRLSWRCSATRPTTSPACPASERRSRPRSSGSSATWSPSWHGRRRSRRLGLETRFSSMRMTLGAQGNW